MKTIYKYPINPFNSDTFETYEGFKPLHVGVDHNDGMCVWLEIDTTNKPIVAEVKVVATGQAIDFYVEGASSEFDQLYTETFNVYTPTKPFQFVGTIIRRNGLVWHIYLR